MERWLARSGFVALSAVLIGRVWLFEVASMANDGMSPGLLSGEAVWVWRGPLADVKPGAVVLYEHSGVRDLKRVVATEGQVVEVSGGTLYLDGAVHGQAREAVSVEVGCEQQEAGAQTERWGEERISVLPGGDSMDERVLPGHVYVLGDNRAESSDSRQWGPIPESAIEGVAGRVLWSRSDCGTIRWFRIGQRIR